MFIYARNASNAGATVEYLHINFGQKPFLFFPDTLGGHDILNTQNIPAATIVNGRDHFAPATYPGTGSEVDLIGTYSSLILLGSSAETTTQITCFTRLCKRSAAGA